MLDLEVKKQIAKEYINQNDLLKNSKNIDKWLSFLMWDIKEWIVTQNIRESLEDFLVSENIFEWLSDKFLKLNPSMVAFLPKIGEFWKINIDEAKNIINNPDIKDENEVRIKLWLNPKNKKQKNKKQNTNNIENNILNIENLSVKEDYIKKKAIKYWITDPNQIAYILSTVKWECWFKNQKEIWWENKPYWKLDEETNQRYYGRGFIQLTHKKNYKKINEIIKTSWEKFKDNNWNYILNIDIVNNPDIILRSDDLASFILIECMKKWLFTWKSLDDYINSYQIDFVWARAIVNWNDKAQIFAQNAQNYLTNKENISKAA